MTFESWAIIGAIAAVFGCASAFDKHGDMDVVAFRTAILMFFGALLGPLSIPVAFVMVYRRYCEYVADERLQFERENMRKSVEGSMAKSLPHKTDGEAP